MMSPSTTAPSYDWREEGFDPDAYRGAHALAPISLGLAIPPLALIVAVPGMTAYWALMLVLYLLVIFVFTAVIFVRAVLRDEAVAQVQLDGTSKTIAVTRKGGFGNTVTYHPLETITDAYLHVRYDDDGYKVVEPRLRLKSGEDIALPGDVTSAQLNTVRGLIASR